MSVVEGVVYPLIVLGVGTALSIWLVPKFTNSYARKRHHIEIKHDLITQITEHRSKALSIVDAYQQMNDADIEAYSFISEYLHKFDEKTNLCESSLNFYFDVESRVIDSWSEYFYLIDLVHEFFEEPEQSKIID